MGRIVLAPNSTSSVTNWTGLPTTGPTILHLNVDELLQSLPAFPDSPPGDGDNSYCATTSGVATIRFGFPAPLGPVDHTHYLITYPEYGYRYLTEPPNSTFSNNIKLYKDNVLVSGTSWETSAKTGWQQFDDPEGTLGSFLRFPVKYTKTDAESSTWELEFIATSPATTILTSIQLIFHTGFVETAQGGVKLGGVADFGKDRQARVGVKVGGRTPDSYVEIPEGGAIIAPNFNIKEFNDAIPSIGGGALIGGSGISAFFTKRGFLRKTFNINEDLIFTYSGGQLNASPNASLGGKASPFIIEAGLNNLFDDISPTVADTGQVDYRCFYIFNDHENETIYNIKIWINTEVEGGSNIKLGIDSRDELQSVILDAIPDSGFFTVRYEPSNPFGFAPVKVARPPGLTGTDLLEQFAENFQSALRLNPDLRDVTVSANVFGAGIAFEILFENFDGKREQENLTILENSLSPTTNISVREVIKGSPINSIAAQINLDITPPGGVIFSLPSIEFPFIIPKLREGEGFHLWIERTVTPGDIAVEKDGFNLGVSVEPIEPAIS